MVLAKDKVECILKCKLFSKQCIELHCRKYGKGKLIQKLKKGIMNITKKFEMNSE